MNLRKLGSGGVVLFVALGLTASAASAEPLSMNFSEARANVGAKQLSDAPLFKPPETAPFGAALDPGSGAITAGDLQMPEFSTFITDPINADVTVDFELGVITGSYTQANGALTLSGEAGGTLSSEGKECTVSTVPAALTLSTSKNSGGANPRDGEYFTNGLTGSGAIAGRWTDMTARPVVPGVDVLFCEDVEEHIGGPGGIWLYQAGDQTSPPAPRLSGTDPAEGGLDGTPRILGGAETGSTVRIYPGPDCAGEPAATGSAAELASPGVTVQVPKSGTAVFSATATDAAGNVSPCSAPIAYTRLHADPVGPLPGTPRCIVPKLVGKTLPRAKVALRKAHCSIGKVHEPKRVKGGVSRLVVRSSTPGVGASPANGKVHLRLGPTHRNARG